MQLSNGQTIWDFSGNAWEWTDWTPGGALDSAPSNCTLSGALQFINFKAFCPGLVDADFMPSNPAGVSPSLYNYVNYNLGTVTGSQTDAVIRSNGIFSLSFGYGNGFTSSIIGFRCVYRP
jgi:formylglycine-generating enzyme required for sulfatase activity